MRRMDRDDTSFANEIKENFIVDWSKDPRNWRKHFAKYGKTNVEEWVKEDYVIIKANDLAMAEKIRADEFSSLKSKAYTVVREGLDGKLGEDHQASFAKWVLSGERAFAEAYAKAKGESAAGSSDSKEGTILELVNYVKKTD